MNRLPETNRGVVTSWIPITTAYPHQAGCENFLWKFVPTVIAAWDPGYGLSVNPEATCLPKPVTTWWLQDRLGPTTETILSIGPITCPEDYYTATASAKDSSSTFVACCPMNYDFVSFFNQGSTGECTSEVKKGDVVTYATRNDTWKITSSSATAATTVAAIPVNGWTFATPTDSSADGCAASVSEALASQIATGSASCNATSGGGISSGAAAGIGVGVSLGVAGLAALGAGLFMMYRTRKAARKQPEEAHFAHFANSGGKDMNTSAQVFPTYTPDPRETPSPSERPQYHQPCERDAWNATMPCLPQQSSSTHVNAKTVPHGEMEGMPFQNIDERTRKRMELEGTLYQDMNRSTIGAGAIGLAELSSEDAKRRMELEGEFDRNVKVSSTSPWRVEFQPVPPSQSSSSSHYHSHY
ncbi:hypothetical protein F4804DRAFT_176767 [Jackrogersella minutella]|nr:hypothetical protein F4804DRAFT_176767 [Jackrogersella minutella]